MAKALRAARQIQAGTIWINTYGRFGPAASFGGYKMSGYGRELGADTLDACTQTKTVWMRYENRRTNFMELKGKRAVITGATGGIGEAVAAALNPQGISLLLTDRAEEKLTAQAKEYRRANFLAADITDPQTPQKLIDAALEHFGSVDVVFSNAGSMLTGPIESIDIEKVCEMVRLDIEAPFRLAYTVLRHMSFRSCWLFAEFAGMTGGVMAYRITLAGCTHRFDPLRALPVGSAAHRCK